MMTDTPLKRDCRGRGPRAQASPGRPLSWIWLEPPETVANLALSSTAGQLSLSATWDALEGATSYRLRWRESGGEFAAANTATVSDATATITVSSYGRWEVRVQGCNDAGCGPEASSTADATPPPTLGLRLTPASLTDSSASPHLITASWDPVPGATSHNLRWRRSEADAQEWNSLNLPGERTSANFEVETDGKHDVSLEVYGPEDRITSYASQVDVRVTARLNAVIGYIDNPPVPGLPG